MGRQPHAGTPSKRYPLTESWIETRSYMLRCARKYSWFGDLGVVRALDAIAPGWKRARLSHIVGAEEPNGYRMDILHEVRGGVSLRGWDLTGAINE